MKPKKLKKEFEINIEETTYPSMGIGYYEGRTMYVKNTFPGQSYWGRHMKNHNGIGIILPLEKLKKAEYETEPLCLHYDKCGGCMSQEIPYKIQTDFKEKEVIELFRSNGLEFKEYLGLIESPQQYGYRNKMEYTFGDEVRDGELCLGMHLKGRKNAVVTTDQCKLVSHDFNLILKATLDYFTETGTPYYRTMLHTGILRNLILREGKNTNELMVILVTTDFDDFDKESFINTLLGIKTNAAIKSIVHCINNSLQDAVIPEKVEVIYGEDHITESVLGMNFKITPFSFFQTNTGSCELLYETVRELAGEVSGKHVFDLYCGTGTIGNIMAKNASSVTGIELIEEAAVIAKENSEVNGLKNTTFIAGDVKDVIKDLTGKPDLIIIDPPRSGLHPKALEYMLQFEAEEIIYVSCNPKTFVEDIKKMGDKVSHEKLVILDNYPNTNHIESIALLTKIN